MGATIREVLGAFAARPRLLISAAIGLAVGLVSHGGVATRILIGWDSAIGLWLLLAAAMMARSTDEDIQRRADREDAGALVVLVLMLAGSTMSLVAIAAELKGASGHAPRLGSLALAGLTILLSWLFVHTIFALHYAHDYYAGEDDREGLKFPGDDSPDYWDFMYFAFNLGAASQTSDVMIEAKRMRRFALAHSVLSFLFNTSILALAINVGASLLSSS